MILNQAQAQAVYNAMCALNNVGARLSAHGIGYDADGFAISAEQSETGLVSIGTGFAPHAERKVLERHGGKNAFATAYGLNPDEPQSAVAAAAGGLRGWWRHERQ